VNGMFIPPTGRYAMRNGALGTTCAAGNIHPITAIRYKEVL
jgi:hypothetical protein